VRKPQRGSSTCCEIGIRTPRARAEALDSTSRRLRDKNNLEGILDPREERGGAHVSTGAGGGERGI